MKLTKKQALELTRDMWDWLSEDENRKKSEWLANHEFPFCSILHNCFLCEYAKLDQVEYPYTQNCNECPLVGRWVKDYPQYDCETTGSPFLEWCGFDNRCENAKRIADLCREALAEL